MSRRKEREKNKKDDKKMEKTPKPCRGLISNNMLYAIIGYCNSRASLHLGKVHDRLGVKR